MFGFSEELPLFAAVAPAWPGGGYSGTDISWVRRRISRTQSLTLGEATVETVPLPDALEIALGGPRSLPDIHPLQHRLLARPQTYVHLVHL